MNPNLSSVAAWSYGLAGFAYSGLAIYLGLGWRGGLRGRALAIAVGLTVAWAVINLLFAMTQAPSLFALANLVDALRMGGWYAFLLLLYERPQAGATASAPQRPAWIVPVAVALVAMGAVAQVLAAFRFTVFGDPQRFAILTSLALTVFGLVMLEQLFRNLPEDARWNIKPLCLGLAGAFTFDLYLFAEMLLFNKVDVDASSVRGFVYVLIFPLLVVSTMRTRNWTSAVVLSRRVVFHS